MNHPCNMTGLKSRESVSGSSESLILTLASGACAGGAAAEGVTTVIVSLVFVASFNLSHISSISLSHCSALSLGPELTVWSIQPQGLKFCFRVFVALHWLLGCGPHRGCLSG